MPISTEKGFYDEYPWVKTLRKLTLLLVGDVWQT